MNPIKLVVLGIKSNHFDAITLKGFTKDFDVDSYIDLFCSYSDFEVPIGTMFCNILNNELKIEVSMKLLDVTQQFGLPFNSIPLGHKTIARFELPEHQIAILRTRLHLIDSWDDSNEKWILESCN